MTNIIGKMMTLKQFITLLATIFILLYLCMFVINMFPAHANMRIKKDVEINICHPTDAVTAYPTLTQSPTETPTILPTDEPTPTPTAAPGSTNDHLGCGEHSCASSPNNDVIIPLEPPDTGRANQ